MKTLKLLEILITKLKMIISEPDLNSSTMEESKSRKKTSSVWNFCEVIDSSYARCTICDHKLSYKSSVTNLRKHFKKKHPNIVMPASMQCVRNGISANRDSSDSDNERNETERATKTVLVDYLRPAGEESRSHISISRVQSTKQAHALKREYSPERHDCRRDSKRSRNWAADESEFELFGRSVVMQLKQLPLVHALEVQAEIMNLIVQKRIQALRQTHETNTEEIPMQYALVYAAPNPEPTSQQNSEDIQTIETAKTASGEENSVASNG